ncbi:hypothetical protein [Deinococcus arcticus]|uniref:Uncharacterized protein n=1 Tax=Deinococcus arcticus TaxID=2136176 RepID=A0A2T3W904_9DEIO|nr:hypothetical protein [Deinococcus arcticus]PTA68307.1 hypothetical protein C8263_07630 [Deinococcus arcticus]
MTQRAPSERAVQALQATGMNETPLAALERDDALFALTAQTLLYQDSGGTRRVTLRDLTRIHSDQEGTLRVETPAGTALSASLLGFDPASVQQFFGQVRDATARAKEQPGSPLPQAGAAKTFAPAPASAQGAPVSAAPARPAPAPPAPIPTVRPVTTPAAERPTPPAASSPAARPAVTEAAPSSQPVPTSPERPVPTPVVISSSGFSPSPARPEVRPDARPETPAPPAPSAGLALRGSAGAAATLARQADQVAGLGGRLRLLGAVLFVGALALAFFQFQGGEALAGLWTLLAGGVGTIAVMALADLARLLVALARASVEGAGLLDVD